MDIRKTIEKILNEKNSDMMLEKMKYRADRGLLEGITSNDITRIVEELESNYSDNCDSLTGTIAEISEAVDKFGYLAEGLDEPTTDVIEESEQHSDSTSILNKKKSASLKSLSISESELERIAFTPLSELLGG